MWVIVKLNPPYIGEVYKDFFFLHTNWRMLENGLMPLYKAFQFKVIMPPLYIQDKDHELSAHLLHMESTFTPQFENR